MKIIKIHSLTWYFLLVSFLCGYIKTGIIIFLIIVFHELGHIFFIKLYHYNILRITIYPFGGITKIEKKINTPNKKELIIAFGGVFFQIVLFCLCLLPLSSNTKEIFIKYNTSILFFNLLPIIPLDGSHIIEAILNEFFSYKTSYYIYSLISFCSIILYIIGNYWFSLNNYLIIMLFLLKSYDAIKNYKYLYNRFLLERYLDEFSFKRISTKKGTLDILRKETYQYFKENENVVSEKQVLKRRFDKIS